MKFARETVCTAPNPVRSFVPRHDEARSGRCIGFAPRNSIGCNLVVTLLEVTSPALCKHQASIDDCVLCARCGAVSDVIWMSAHNLSMRATVFAGVVQTVSCLIRSN